MIVSLLTLITATITNPTLSSANSCENFFLPYEKMSKTLITLNSLNQMPEWVSLLVTANEDLVKAVKLSGLEVLKDNSPQNSRVRFLRVRGTFNELRNALRISQVLWAGVQNDTSVLESFQKKEQQFFLSDLEAKTKLLLINPLLRANLVDGVLYVKAPDLKTAKIIPSIFEGIPVKVTSIAGEF